MVGEEQKQGRHRVKERVWDREGTKTGRHRVRGGTEKL